MGPWSGSTPLVPARGWHSRGYLPHFDGGPIEQSVTYCLAGAMPREYLAAWRASVGHLGEARARAELLKRIERYLDRGVGEPLLRDPKAAAVVENALLHRDAEQYHLHAWAVMPNHVHVLFTQIAGRELSKIVQAWKWVSARRINRLLARRGRLWQEDYFDRYIRDADHFETALRYIEHNPVRAGLCAEPEYWPFGSARRRAAEVTDMWMR